MLRCKVADSIQPNVLAFNILIASSARTDGPCTLKIMVRVKYHGCKEKIIFAPFLSGKHQWWLPFAIASGRTKILAKVLQGEGRIGWNDSWRRLFDQTPSTFAAVEMQRFVIFCNTAETGVLWRAEQWLERLCSSRCRHGIFTAWWHRHICSAHEVDIGQAWCDVLHAAGSLGVCKSDRNRRLKQMIHLGTADLRLLAGYARCGATVCDLESSSRQPYSYYLPFSPSHA